VGRSVAVTDYRGVFSFPNLPLGKYTLTFFHPNYKEQDQQVELFQGGQRDMRILMVRRGPENAPPGPPIAAWALQIPGPAQKKYSQGLEALQKNQVRESIAHFQAAIELYPRFAAAYAALGSAQLTLGDRKAAAAAFEKALEIDDNLPAACLGLGTLYAMEQRYADAEKQLLRAQMLKPEDWRVHYQLGEIFWRMGNWSKGEESLRRGVELHPEFARLHLLLMNVLALQEKYPEALAEMEKFLRMFPQDSFAPQVRQKRDLLKAQIEKTAILEPSKKPPRLLTRPRSLEIVP
jgi:tetratricopeptide (TPR) repeat protein